MRLMEKLDDIHFQIRCSSLVACVSFDFNYGTNLCWIHFTNVDLLYSGTDFDHYERIPCPTTAITPSSSRKFDSRVFL